MLLIQEIFCTNTIKMETTKIRVSAMVNAPIEKVWHSYLNPTHIVHWNFADPSWHCPSAENDMRIGGIYKARMECRDGSFGFDFEAVYTEILMYKSFSYEFGGRTATVHFNDVENQTEVMVSFDPENENPIEMQRSGWQLILNNFKHYTETV